MKNVVKNQPTPLSICFTRINIILVKMILIRIMWYDMQESAKPDNKFLFLNI